MNPTMNPKQEQFFNNLQKNLEGGAVQPEELITIVEAILTFIRNLRTELETSITNSQSEASTAVTEVTYKINDLELRLKDLINGSERTSLTQIKELSTRISNEINRVEDAIPTLPDLSSIQNKIIEVEAKIPILKEQIFETPDEIVDKFNASSKTISQDKIEGLITLLADLKRIAVANANSFPVTTSFFNGLRAKNLNIVGATARLNGDTVNITGASGGQVNSVVAGTGISVDNTDPINPIVSATGSATGYQSPTGTVNGINTVFVFLIAPNALVVDGVPLRKVATDGTVNWTGTTSITLTVAPNFDIYAVA